MMSVIQPPSKNLVTTVPARMLAAITSPASDSANRRRHLSWLRCLSQYTHSPASDSVNVMKTLIEYSTTSISTRPPVIDRMASAATPMTRMPFCVTSRCDR